MQDSDQITNFQPIIPMKVMPKIPPHWSLLEFLRYWNLQLSICTKPTLDTSDTVQCKIKATEKIGGIAWIYGELCRKNLNLWQAGFMEFLMILMEALMDLQRK